MSAGGSRLGERIAHYGEKLLPRVIALAPWEKILLRAAFAVVVWISIRWGLPFEGQPKPNGIAHWVDLGFLTEEPVIFWLKPAVILSLILYGVGLCPSLTLLLPLAVSIGVGTLVNSQGAINHDKQIVSLVLLGQWIVAVIAAVRGGGFFWIRSLWGDLVAHVSRVVIVACYVVSAGMKLDESDGKWITEGVPRLAIQLRKTNLSKYYSDLTPVDHFASEKVPALIAEFPLLAMAVFGGGMLLELFCFLGLAGRRWGLFIGLSLIALHLSVGRLMELHFMPNIYVVLIYFVAIGLGKKTDVTTA